VASPNKGLKGLLDSIGIMLSTPCKSNVNWICVEALTTVDWF
jgi:hypothetical protein